MEQTRRAFAQLVAPGHGRLAGHLDEGALLIASALDPTVVVAEQIERLDALAESVPASSVAELAQRLFGGSDPVPAVHFRGNAANYYDVENSLLHRVLDRRVGIPITLAVVLIEIGRRHDLSLHGVGMPGHFLVGSAEGFVDPFHGGAVLDAQGCQQLFARLAGPGAALPQGALEATAPTLILKRMLYNLASIGVDQERRRALRAVRALLAAFPDANHRDHVQHAYAAAELGQFDEAASAAEAALVTIPEQVRDKLQAQIDGWRARLN